MSLTTAQQRARAILGGLAAGRSVLTTLGFRTFRVFVTVRTWQGGRIGAPGGYVDRAIYQNTIIGQESGTGLNVPPGVGLEITPRPKCRFISTREIASSAGLYHEGDMRVTSIQPFWIDQTTRVQHGYTMQDLAPDESMDGVEVIYRVVSDTGSIASDYSRIGTVTEYFGHYELILRSRLTTANKF